MAEFYAPQIQAPDILGAYIRGRMAPLQMQQAQQQVEAGGLDLQKLRLALQQQQMTTDYASKLAGQVTQAGGAQSTQTPTGGVQNGPQGAVSGESTPFNGGSVNTMMALDVLAGRDPLKTAQGAQEYELKQRQLQAQQPIALFDSIINSPSPARIVMNNPGLMQRWQQVAAQQGLDPVKDFNDDNIRQTMSFARNQIAGQAGLPTVQPPHPLQQIKGPNGQILSKDAVTGEVKQEVGQESLHPVIGDNGQPTLLPASQAAGKTPFNQSIFGAANMSDQAIQFAADTYRTTGKMPTTMGRNPAMQAKVLEKVAADAAANGDTTGAITARAAALKANGEALNQGTKLESATTAFYNTLDKNIDQLVEAAKHVDSTGSPLVNKAFRAWQQGVTGDKDTAQMVTWLNAVESEYAKISSGALGNAPVSDAAKRDAKEVINKNFSAGGMEAVAQVMKAEGQNRLNAIRQQNQDLQQRLGTSAPGTPPQPTPQRQAPPAALEYLKAHPEAAPQFKAKYGYLPQ